MKYIRSFLLFGYMLAAILLPAWGQQLCFCHVCVPPGTPLQPVINAAPVGAVICMLDGLWKGPLTINKSLTLRGQGSAVAYGKREPDGDTVVVKGTVIDGNGPLGALSSETVIEATSNAVKVNFEGFAIVAERAWGLIAEGPGSVTLRDISVTRKQPPAQEWIGGGILFNNVQGGGLFNSFLGVRSINNGEEEGFEGSGVVLMRVKNFQISNSEIRWNGRHGLEVSNTQGLEIWDTIIRGNRECGLYADQVSTVTGRHNAILDNGYRQDLCGSVATRRDLLDQIAPAPPRITKPEPQWTNNPNFEIDWENPRDISGIAAFHYKIGSAPSKRNGGFKRSIDQKPLAITLSKEQQGKQPVYIWLEDGMGNYDERNNASVELHYEAQAPVITFIGRNPPPHICDQAAPKCRLCNPNKEECWHNTPVEISWACQDALSEPAETKVTVRVSEQGRNLSATGTCKDNAGNESEHKVNGINIDWTKPEIMSKTADPAFVIEPIIVPRGGTGKTFSRRAKVKVRAEDPTLQEPDFITRFSSVPGSGVADVRFWNADQPNPMSWLAYKGGDSYGPYSEHEWELSSPIITDCSDEKKIVKAQVRDKAGNESDWVIAGISFSWCPKVPDDFASIQTAINAVDSDLKSIVLLQRGTFVEHLEVAKTVTLQGSGPGNTILKGQKTGKPVLSIKGTPPKATIKGVSITEAKRASGVLLSEKANVEIQDSWIHGNEIDGISVLDSATATISKSRIFNNGDDGLDVGNLANLTIEDTIIEANGSDTRCRDLSVLCNGVEVWDRAQVTVRRSVIRSNADWGVTARLRKCGFSTDYFTGPDVKYEGMNAITENGQGQVCPVP